MKYVENNGCELIIKFDTEDLCYAINGGIIEGKTFFCGAFSNKCLLYSLEINDDKQFWYLFFICFFLCINFLLVQILSLNLQQKN